MTIVCRVQSDVQVAICVHQKDKSTHLSLPARHKVPELSDVKSWHGPRRTGGCICASGVQHLGEGESGERMEGEREGGMEGERDGGGEGGRDGGGEGGRDGGVRVREGWRGEREGREQRTSE